MSSNKFDSAILDLGDDEGVTHSFGKNVPDSALDQVMWFDLIEREAICDFYQDIFSLRLNTLHFRMMTS